MASTAAVLPRRVRATSSRSLPEAGADDVERGAAGTPTPLWRQLAGSTLLRRYDFGVADTLLGTGTFGQVYKARDVHTGEPVAIKLLGWGAQTTELTDVVRECSIMLTLAAHPTVVRFHDLLRLPRYGDAFAIVMELVPGGELYSFIVQHGPLPERDARDVTRQLLDALRYMHARRIAHRDLKLENILLLRHVQHSASGNGGGSEMVRPLKIKLIDFGFAKRLAPLPSMRHASRGAPDGGATALLGLPPPAADPDGLTTDAEASVAQLLQRLHAAAATERSAASVAAPPSRAQLDVLAQSCRGMRRFNSAVGSVYYMAPEVSPMRSSLFGYGLSADLWSAGVCAYAMLAAEFPFSAGTDGELLLGLSQGPELVMDAPPWARVSPQCRDLVARLLRPTAQLRPTAAAALRHDWFAEPAAPSSASAALAPAGASEMILEADNATAASPPPPPPSAVRPCAQLLQCFPRWSARITPTSQLPRPASPPPSPSTSLSSAVTEGAPAEAGAVLPSRGMLHAVRSRIARLSERRQSLARMAEAGAPAEAMPRARASAAGSPTATPPPGRYRRIGRLSQCVCMAPTHAALGDED